MKTFIHKRNLIATTLAVSLGLASTGALAMTGEHDIDFAAPGNAERAVIIIDARGAVVVENEHYVDRGSAVAENTIGGRVHRIQILDSIQ